MLYEFHFVTLWGVNEDDDRARRCVMRSVAERVALRCGLLGKRVQICDFEGEMGEVRSYHHGAAGVILADLDFLGASGGLQKDQLGTASALAPSDFLQTEDVAVKRNRLLKVLNAIAGVEEFGDHFLEDVT